MIPDAFLIPNTLWVFSESCGLSFRTNFLNCEFRIPCLHLFLKHHRSAASSFEKIWKAELLLFCIFLWWFLMILRFGSKNLQRVDSKNRSGWSQNDSRLWELCLTLQIWYCGVFFYETRSTHSILQYIYIYTVYIIFISNHTKSTWNTIEVHKFHKFTCLYILSHYPFHLFSCLAGFPVREILTTNRTSSAKINTCDSRWQPIFKRNHDEAIKPIWDIVETMALTSW